MITSAPSTPRFDTTQTAAAAATAATAASQPGGAMGKDQFMKLLIAQMQNQDPTNPMDGSQMAAQLAQFSSLEQLQNINTTLTGQTSASGSLLGAIQASSAVGMIGHTVTAAGNSVHIGGDSGATTVTANMSGAAATSTLHIFNSAGTEVATEDLGSSNSGTQTFSLNDAVKGLPAGNYTYSIDAKDSAGAAVAVQTYTTGKVDGISTGANGLVLSSGGMSIPYANVIQITN